MKILASNPDTIGDMVLRQPLYRALLEAGHELLLIVRPSVAPLVPFVAPGARILLLPIEVYRDDIDAYWSEFTTLWDAARQFRPDVTLIAPYQWTRFEERLVDEVRAGGPTRAIGMRGHVYAGDPYAGHGPRSTLMPDLVVDVIEQSAEVEKNAALAAALLGHPLAEIDPRITPDGPGLDAAKAVLSELGLETNSYWVACVGGTIHVPIKAWPAQRWAELLGGWFSRYGRRFLFVGVPEERPLIDEVMALLPEAARAVSAVWIGAEGTLSTLIGLSALSSGYVGHDTGPMHLAAAVGRPVLAVFGGGHWPRFVPRAAPGVSITVGVACIGCRWSCSFDTSHCIKEVPVAEVVQAVDDLEGGRVVGHSARALPPSNELRDRMIAEGARFAQRQLRDAAALARFIQEAKTATRPADALAEELAARKADLVAVSAQLDDALAQATAPGKSRDAAQRDADAQRETLAKRATEIGLLREQIARLQAPPPVPVRTAPPRRPMRKVIEDLVTGGRHPAPRRAARPLPSITLVVRLHPSDDPRSPLRTLESALSQQYPMLDLVVALPEDGAAPGALPAWVEPHSGRISRFVSVASPLGPFAGVEAAFETSKAAVLGWLDPGTVLEPGALWAVGEMFRRRPSIKSATFEESRLVGGWRFPAPTPAADVYSLIQRAGPMNLFVRREAYIALGPIDPAKGAAAGWEMALRYARRFGIYAARGHVVCRTASAVDDAGAIEPGSSEAADFEAARSAFLVSFGAAGRARCMLIHWTERVRARARRGLVADPFNYASAAARVVADRLPTLLPPAEPLQAPLLPLNGRPPSRLLFTTRDWLTAPSEQGRAHLVYHDRASAMAVATPPLSPETLDSVYAARALLATKPPIAPAPGRCSPFAGYRGGHAWEHLLRRTSCPLWWAQKPDYSDVSAARLLAAVAGIVRREDVAVRLLVIGCHEGLLLDRLKAFTRWRMSGAETNARSAAIARSKGHQVWETSVEDAAVTLPTSEQFDVICLSGQFEHLQAPLLSLRRLGQLLRPRGLVVFDAPNLDSRLARLFGPTWEGWEPPVHRTIMGRRGVRRLARAAGMRLLRFQTYTDCYRTARTLQLNQFGLAGVVPAGAPIDDALSRDAIRLTGWARLLWDWRGQGDTLTAVLRMR